MGADWKQLLAVGFGLLCLVSGSYLAYSTFSQQSNADKTVEATVLDSSVDVDGRFDDEYTLYIEYSYTYEGTEYTNSNIYPSPGKKVLDEDEARSKLNTYQEGAEVTAYIDTDDPERSYLIDDDSGGSYLGAGVLIVLGLLVTLLFGASALARSLHQGPEEVDPLRGEVRRQLLAAFRELDDYPIESYRDIRYNTLDPSRTFESNDFSFTVRDLDYIIGSEPESPCETPEELTDFVLSEMDEQGYFYKEK